MLLILSGSSAVGKTTLARELCKVLGFIPTISATTRPPRPEDVDGKSYHFLTDGEFDRRIQRGDFLEYATYDVHRYGTLWSAVSTPLRQKRDLVLCIDVVGHARVREVLEDHSGAIYSIFIMPPDVETLRVRLAARGGMSEAEMSRRMRIAEEEMLRRDEYNDVLINGDLEQAKAELVRKVRGRLAQFA